MVKIVLELPDNQARGLSQLVKRLNRRNLDSRDLDLVTAEELDGAEASVNALQDALAKAGFNPR